MKWVLPSRGAETATVVIWRGKRAGCVCACGALVHLCLSVLGAGAGGPILSPWWGDGWLPWGRAGQAKASLEGTIVWQMRYGFPTGAVPSAFIVSNSSLRNSYPQ